MSGIIDFHSHVLPGIDDGSASVEESIAMLQMLAEQGIRHVVATPHFYPYRDSPEQFLRRRADAEARLREQMQKHPDMPGLSVGAEVYYYSGIGNSEEMTRLTIGGGQYLLLEMPMSPWTNRMYEEIGEIRDRLGLIPVIAHVDRYISPLRTLGIPGKLAEMEVLVQANAGFFLRRSTAFQAMNLLKNDRIHLLGSDCHDLVHRPPRLGAAVDRVQARLGTGTLERVAQYQQKVLKK